jgi:hypothetical protein
LRKGRGVPYWRLVPRAPGSRGIGGPRVAVAARQEDEVEVAGHQAVGEQADAGEQGQSLGEHFDERGVVAGVFEHRRAGVAAVEHVEHDAAGGGTGGAGHGAVSYREKAQRYMYLSPFCVPSF